MVCFNTEIFKKSIFGSLLFYTRLEDQLGTACKKNSTWQVLVDGEVFIRLEIYFAEEVHVALSPIAIVTCMQNKQFAYYIAVYKITARVTSELSSAEKPVHLRVNVSSYPS